MKLPRALSRQVRRFRASLFGGGPLHLFDASLRAINPWQLGYHGMSSSGPNATAHACIQAYGQALAQCPVRHYVDDTKRKRSYPDSPIQAVLSEPNPYQSTSDLMLNLVGGLLACGNGYTVARRRGAGIAELHLLPPYAKDTVPRVDSETGAIWYHSTLYDVTGNAGPAIIPSRDVAHARLFAPAHPLLGVSPIEAARASLDVSNAITGRAAQYYQNIAAPGGVLQSDQEIDEELGAQLRASWENMTTGENAGRTPILGWGLRWQQVALSAQDAELIEAWKMSAREIARVYGIPLLLVQLNEGGSYAEAREALNFWRSTGLGFLVRHLEGALARLFGLRGNQGIEIDTEALLRLDFAALVAALGQSTGAGIHAANDARAYFKLGDVTGGDEPRIQMQDIPISSDAANGKEPPAPVVEPAPEELETEAAARRALIAKTLRDRLRDAA